MTFDKTSWKLAVNFPLDNFYFDFSNLSFRQITGISMSSDPTFFLVVSFQIIMEIKWLLVRY